MQLSAQTAEQIAQLKAQNRTAPLQVSGLENFERSEWFRAIIYYLRGIREGHESVTYRPKIDFGGVVLRLNPGAGRYYAYGVAPDEEVPSFPANRIGRVGCGKSEVEEALTRLVDGELGLLTIEFTPGSTMSLWEKGQDFGCHAVGIPTHREVMNQLFAEES